MSGDLSIKVVTPVRVDQQDLARRTGRYQRAASPSVRIEVVNLLDAPTSLASGSDMRASEAALTREVLSTRSDQFHAVLFDCVLDTAVRELRRTSDIPVFGPTQCTLAILPALAEQFSVIARTQAHCELMKRAVEASGHGPMLSGMQTLGISDEESRNPAAMAQAMRPLLRAVADNDPRQVVLMGSTTMDIPDVLKAEFRHLRMLCPGRLALQTIELLWREGALGGRTTPGVR